jgi:hypothetical protein
MTARSRRHENRWKVGVAVQICDLYRNCDDGVEPTCSKVFAFSNTGASAANAIYESEALGPTIGKFSLARPAQGSRRCSEDDSIERSPDYC